MEEAVTRKFVHEESGSITSLCGNVLPNNNVLLFHKNKRLYLTYLFVFNYPLING